MLQSGGQNHRWPTSGQGAYITPAAEGVPTASQRGGGGEHRWRTSGQGGYITPTFMGCPPLHSGGAQSQVAQKWARWLHNPPPPGGPPHLHSGGQNHRWPTSGQGGYINPATGGGAHRFKAWPKSEVSYKWARWLHNPCRLGCPPLHSGGHNLRWSTSGQGGYITPTALWVPTASQRGAESKVAHKWAR